MMASAYDAAPYRKTHVNHPMAKWCRTSVDNFTWALEHGLSLCREYTYRFSKKHKTETVLNWYLNNPPRLNKLCFTEPPQCFSIYREQCFVDKNPIKGYHNYYNAAKRHLFKWTKREIPYFIKNGKI